jgi:hypothetical protein
VAHTLLFINKKWMVADGIQGDAKRVFNITPEQAIEYQRTAFTAQKGDHKKSWKAFILIGEKRFRMRKFR